MAEEVLQAREQFAREIRDSEWLRWYRQALTDNLDNALYRLEHCTAWENALRLQAEIKTYREILHMLE